MTPLITRNGTAMAICTIAATRCTRIVCVPPPPASSFTADIKFGRLKRTAGNSPNIKLTTRQRPAAMTTLTASRSISLGTGAPRYQPAIAGMPNNTKLLIAAATTANTSASKNKY
jgi:hypothetical protein